MSPSQTYRGWAALGVVLAVIVVALPTVMSAQTTPSDQTVPKEDLFLGYQWFNPGGVVPVGNPPTAFQLPSIAPGGGAAFAYNFTKIAALEADFGVNRNSYASASTGTFGPRFTFRQDEGVNFFGHTLLGIERLTPASENSHTNLAAVIGGGIDLKFWKPITLRLFEADYVFARQNFSDQVTDLDQATLRRPQYNGVRLRTGVVFNLGGAPEVPVAAACSIDHTEVMVGEPVHVTVSPSNFNPKHVLTYTWAASGGKISGKDTGASVDTNGAAPGSYTVTATVSDGKAHKNNTASCTSNFTVKPLNPPQISCTASQSSVQAGTSVTITCSCTSPDNAPVTVGGWSASGGSLSGSGNSATLNTTGASPGSITVNATCTDSRGLNASTSTSVTVQNPPPPPPPPPQASKLNECEYPNKMKPWRVDNTCKAALDDVAGKLQQDPDAKLVVVGNAAPNEKRKNLAGERAADVKYYLTQGEAQQHIDASRIECRTGGAGTATSEQWIVPAGAAFPNESSTTPIDEKKVKPIPDHPKPAAKKKAP